METILTRSSIQKIRLKRQEKEFYAYLCICSLKWPLDDATIKSILHPEEFNLFENITVDARKKSFILGRLAAKQALQKFGIRAGLTAIKINYGVFKYPIVEHPDNQKAQVSYSHTDGLCVALAFSESQPMGIDIEKIEPNKIKLTESKLLSTEKDLIKRYRSIKEIPIVLWTAKEALSKILRTGLTLSFEVMAIEKIKKTESYWESEFKNFPQYKAISFMIDHTVCSIVIPKNTEMIMDFEKLESCSLGL